MKILLTGGSSGIGHCLNELLCHDHQVVAPTRQQLDLNDTNQVANFVNEPFDMLINCAGTGVGGKINFVNHDPALVDEIFKVNLLSAVSLTQQILKLNSVAKIVNITSTNNRQYYANDLVYSLSKKSLEEFGNMLKIESPQTPVLEVRVGLTKTNFNQARYIHHPERYRDIYCSRHLLADQVAYEISKVLFDNTIKFIEISP